MIPTLDAAQSPVLIATFHPTLTVEDAVGHFRELTDAVQKVARAAVIVDLRNTAVFSATLRKVGAREMAAVYAKVGDRIAGVAHVVHSPAVRGMLTAVHWLAPPPFPSTVMRDLQTAMRWARERLERADVRGDGR